MIFLCAGGGLIERYAPLFKTKTIRQVRIRTPGGGRIRQLKTPT